MNAVRCCWVCCVELGDFFWSIGDISRVFPRVGFQAITFPFNQILELASEHPAVDNLSYNTFLLSIYEFWQWRLRSVLTWDWVRWSRSQFDYVEDWVKSLHGQGEG